MPLYACPGSLVLSRIPTHHTQILMPVQDPQASHTKPCTVNPWAGAALHKCQPFLTPVQAPDTPHAKSLCLYRFPTIQIIPYTVTGALGQKNKSGLALSNQGTHLEDSKRINKIK
ncbi:hypothetical protein O181_038896 [Austropuccinia psidii MF-1]|uniref:Uncharacterized protein n=1 Tax=Austropuccinia psidii MF-1 TaxID=1389203 RepID=A0A9Q3HC18_9BASI|nr:hypothetical protein [Austropuccinia psidii MF-1]